MDLTAKYQAINQRGTELLLAGGDIDPWLSDRAADRRRGLSLIFTLPAHVSRNISFALGKLREVEPGQYYYPAQDMHVTVIDLIRATPDFALTPEEEAAYVSAVKLAVEGGHPFEVAFRGLVASGRAVMAAGFYQPGLADLRQAVRHHLGVHKLQLKERYQQTTAHVTVARQQAPLIDPHQDLATLATLANLNFGTLVVDQVELVVHDWYNSRKRVLAKLSL